MILSKLLRIASTVVMPRSLGLGSEICLISKQNRFIGFILSLMSLDYIWVESRFHSDVSIACTYYSVKFNTRQLTLREFHREGDFFNRGLLELSRQICLLQNTNRSKDEYLLDGSYGVALGHITIISAIVKDHLINKINSPLFRFNYDFFDKLTKLPADVTDFYLTFLSIIESKFQGPSQILKSNWPKIEPLDKVQPATFGVWNIPRINSEAQCHFHALADINKSFNVKFLNIEEFYECQGGTPPRINTVKPLIGVSIRTNEYRDDNLFNPELRTPNKEKYEIILKELEKDFSLVEFGDPKESKLEANFSISAKTNKINLLDQVYLATKCKFLILTHNGMADILGEFNLPNILCDHSPTNHIWHHDSIRILRKSIKHKNSRIQKLLGNLKYERNVPADALICETTEDEIRLAVAEALSITNI